jgi:hypothetical protein
MKNTLNKYDLIANRLCIVAAVVILVACSGPDQLYQDGPDQSAGNTAKFPRLADHTTPPPVKTTDPTALVADLNAAAIAAAARRHSLAASD